MGLIQAALSAAGSTFADQWKEYFYCEAIPSNIIAVKGQKKVRGLSSNHGDDNIISDGSVIAVADGQCMIIVEQGQVVDICAQPGEFKYDSTTEPSLFTGNLGEGIKNVFGLALSTVHRPRFRSVSLTGTSILMWISLSNASVNTA